MPSVFSLSHTHTNTHRVTHCLLCFCLSHRNPHRGWIYVKDPTLLLSSHPFSFPLYISSSNIEVSEKQRLCSKEAQELSKSSKKAKTTTKENKKPHSFQKDLFIHPIFILDTFCFFFIQQLLFVSFLFLHFKVKSSFFLPLVDFSWLCQFPFFVSWFVSFWEYILMESDVGSSLFLIWMSMIEFFFANAIGWRTWW